MDDDLEFLEDACAEIEVDIIRKKLKTLEQDELCQILGIKNEEGSATGDTSFIYELCEGGVLPEELKEKIDRHYDTCYSCKELYQDYLNRDKFLRDLFS